MMVCMYPWEIIVCQRLGDTSLLVPSHMREAFVTDGQTAMHTDDMQGMLTQRCLLNVLGATQGYGIPRGQLEDPAPLPIVRGQLGSFGQRRETLLWRCGCILQTKMLEAELVLEDSVVPSVIDNMVQISEAAMANLPHVSCHSEAIVASVAHVILGTRNTN